MKPDSIIPVITLIVGAILGYMAGLRSGETTVALPSNYDPTRAVVADALKAQQEQTENCYKSMVAKLQADLEKKPDEVVTDKGQKCAVYTNEQGVKQTICGKVELPKKAHE